MSAEAAYFLAGARRHDALLEVLEDLEAVQCGYPDELVPPAAIQLQASVWEFLKAYGRRDERGHVDEQPTPRIQAWRPSAAQLAAHKAGLPVPPDEEDRSHVGLEVNRGGAHPEQVGVLSAQDQLEAERLLDRSYLGRDADLGDRDGVGDGEAAGNAAGGALEVRGEGSGGLDHGVQHGGLA